MLVLVYVHGCMGVYSPPNAKEIDSEGATIHYSDVVHILSGQVGSITTGRKYFCKSNVRPKRSTPSGYLIEIHGQDILLSGARSSVLRSRSHLHNFLLPHPSHTHGPCLTVSHVLSVYRTPI